LSLNPSKNLLIPLNAYYTTALTHLFKGQPMTQFVATQEQTQGLIYRVFSWMTLGLLVTATWSYFIAVNGWDKYILTRPYLGLVLLIAQLALVIVLAGFIQRLSFTTAAIIFMTYSVLTGTTLSYIFTRFSLPSIIQTLLITAGMFAAAALWGYFTKADLSKFRSILTMALFGIIIAMLVNMFIKSSGVNLAISLIGVVLFSALTAYDLQMIKRMANQMVTDDESYAKMGLLGALQLYLDFINLFLSLLNVMGRRRQ